MMTDGHPVTLFDMLESAVAELDLRAHVLGLAALLEGTQTDDPGDLGYGRSHGSQVNSPRPAERAAHEEEGRAQP
jgi:hypothetical protein